MCRAPYRLHRTSFYGNAFPSYKETDWPGMDELDCHYGATSGAHVEGGPVTPKLVSSAVHLWNKEHAMSESFCICSPSTKIESIEEVMAQYGWEAVLSIQEKYSAEELGRFNDFVGRVNSLVNQGRFTADVAILYPIASVWEGFKPTRRHVHNLADNPKAREVDEAWRWVSAEVLSAQRALVEDLWSHYPGRVIHTLTREAFHQAVAVSGKPDLAISPSNREIYYHHRIVPQGERYFLVNNATTAFQGNFTLSGVGKVELWDPVDGTMRPLQAVTKNAQSIVELTLPSRSDCRTGFEKPADSHRLDACSNPPAVQRDSGPNPSARSRRRRVDRTWVGKPAGGKT